MGVITLLWNLLVSKFFLREKLDKVDYWGTSVAILGMRMRLFFFACTQGFAPGVIVCTVFGPHVTADYGTLLRLLRRGLTSPRPHCCAGISDLLRLYIKIPFIILVVVGTAFMLFLFQATLRDVSYRRISSAALPGCFGGITALFSKSAVELVKHAALGGKGMCKARRLFARTVNVVCWLCVRTDFQHPVTYMIIIALIVSAVSQLKFLNKTLKVVLLALWVRVRCLNVTLCRIMIHCSLYRSTTPSC